MGKCILFFCGIFCGISFGRFGIHGFARIRIFLFTIFLRIYMNGHFYCSSCGAALEGSENRCPKCGVELGGIGEGSKRDRRNVKRKHKKYVNEINRAVSGPNPIVKFFRLLYGICTRIIYWKTFREENKNREIEEIFRRMENLEDQHRNDFWECRFPKTKTVGGKKYIKLISLQQKDMGSIQWSLARHPNVDYFFDSELTPESTEVNSFRTTLFYVNEKDVEFVRELLEGLQLNFLC